jgi:hypothetical protein
VLSDYQKNNVPSDDYAISIKLSGSIIKRALTKRDSTVIINVNNVPAKKSKNAFDDVLLKHDLS